VPRSALGKKKERDALKQKETRFSKRGRKFPKDGRGSKGNLPRNREEDTLAWEYCKRGKDKSKRELPHAIKKDA